MKLSVFCSTLFLATAFASLQACHKDKSSDLSDSEKQLLKFWNTKKIIIEQSGQPTVTQDPLFPTCGIEFKDQPYYIYNSGIYTNAKVSNDNKTCASVANAWKIDSNGKLLLASPLDTIYADILIVGSDTLAFRTIDPDNPDLHITYQFK